MTAINAPPMRCRAGRYSCRARSFASATFAASVMTTNGTHSPSAYTKSSPAPTAALPCSAANARMVPKIGPTHGVQPNENAKPSTNAPRMPRTWILLRFARFSLFRKGIRITPAKCRPKMNTRMPSAMATYELSNADPSAPAPAPSVTNTQQMPSTNAMVFAQRRPSPSVSEDASVVSTPTYTGNSGRMHGEKNDSNPAPAADATRPKSMTKPFRTDKARL